VRLWLALFASLAAATAAMPSAAPAQVAAGDAAFEARLAKARALVALTDPYPVFVELNMKGWEIGVGRALALDPASATLEARYPGITKAGIEAARPLAREYCALFVKRNIERKARLLAERLTANDLDQATAFYDSPAGRRLIRNLTRNADLGIIATDAAVHRAQRGEPALTAESAHEMELDAARSTLSQTSADDHLAILRFQQTPAAPKYVAVAAESDRLALEEANHPDPAWMAHQSEVIRTAMIAFADAHAKPH
jgi:hypothetical protein